MNDILRGRKLPDAGGVRYRLGQFYEGFDHGEENGLGYEKGQGIPGAKGRARGSGGRRRPDAVGPGPGLPGHLHQSTGQRRRLDLGKGHRDRRQQAGKSNEIERAGRQVRENRSYPAKRRAHDPCCRLGRHLRNRLHEGQQAPQSAHCQMPQWPGRHSGGLRAGACAALSTVCQRPAIQHHRPERQACFL